MSLHKGCTPVPKGLPWWLKRYESACSSSDQGRSLGWEDPLKEGMATRFSILAWRIPWTEEPGGATVQGVAQSQTRLSNSHTFKVPTEGFGMRRLADHHFAGKATLAHCGLSTCPLTQTPPFPGRSRPVVPGPLNPQTVRNSRVILKPHAKHSTFKP